MKPNEVLTSDTAALFTDNEHTVFLKKIIPLVVAVVMFMEFLDSTIINTAIPTIARSFGQDPILMKFAVTSYLLSLAIFTPISGWVADKLGTQRVFLGSVGLFVVASFFCGISTNILELTIFRLIQGMGGAFMNPVSRIIIIRLFPPKDIVRIQGIIFTPALLGLVVGPFAGGLITTYLDWSWIFFINIPVGLAVFYYGFRFIPQQKDESPKKFDFLGFLLSAISLGCISFAIDMIGHYNLVPKGAVVWSGFFGVILFFTLLYHCFKKPNPVLDFLILNIHTFRIGISSSLPLYMVSASIAFLLPLMFQEVFGYSAFESGALVLPMAVGQCTLRFIAPKIIPKFGFKTTMQISSFILIACLVLIAQVNVHTPLFWLIVVEFVFGSALVLHMSCTGALNYIDVPKSLSSRATSLDLTLRQFFSSLGIGISALSLTFLGSYFDIKVFSANGGKAFHYTLIFIVFVAAYSFLNSFFLGRHEGEHALKK